MAILQNLGVLKYRDKDGNWKPLPVVLQSSGGGGSGGISTISGKGQPTESTVGRLNQLYRDESTDKLYICTGVEGGYTWAAVVSDTEDAVTYTAQTLTEEQKTQARANIGAGTSNFSGSYNDLTHKPNIPAASVIDTTLSKSGQAADAKAAGDAIGRKIDAPQVAQVNEVLTVEEVDEDGKPIKWKVTKVTGTFVCAFDGGDDGWITCDKTVEEIITANNNGKDVIGHYYGDIYRLSTPFETGGGYCNPIFTNLGVGVLSIIQYDAGHFGINRIRLSDIAPEDSPDPYEVPVCVPTEDGKQWQYGRPLLATDYAMNELTDEEKALMQKNLGIDALPSPTTAQVGQIVKVKTVDANGKITETEAVDMPTALHDYELVFQETVAEDVLTYSRDTNKDGNPFSLTDVMVIIFTKPFAESTNNGGRAVGFLPTTSWGHNTVLGISSAIKSGGNEVGYYDVAYVKVINGYQICDRYYRSQNATNVFGTMQERTAAGETGVQFHCDATKIMEISRPQGNITCVKIVGYSNPLVSAGTIIALYKKKGT